jgi:hypothetical protein
MSGLRKIYIPILLGVIAYAAFFFYQANDISHKVYERDGSFEAQPLFQVLNFDATDRLVEQLSYYKSQTEWFRNMFSDLNGFVRRAAYQDVPVLIVGKVGAQELKFDRFFAKRSSLISDPRFSIQTEQLRYGDPESEQNKCRNELAGQGRRLSFGAVAPFSAIGIVKPPAKCHIFLWSRRSHASLKELCESARQISDWHGIVYYLPVAVYFVFVDDHGAVISSLNDYLDHSISVNLFDAFSIDGSRCESFNNCVAGQLQSLVFEPGNAIAATWTKSDLVRTDSLRSDQYYLVAELKPTATLKRAELIFRTEPVDIRIDAIVPDETLAKLDKLGHFEFEVSLEDANLSRPSFAYALWVRKLQATEIGLSGAKVNVLFAGGLLLALAFVDLIVPLVRPKKASPEETFDPTEDG